MTSQVALVVKNLPANAAEKREMGLISGLGRSLEAWQPTPVFLPEKNPMDRRAWQATVQGVAKESDTTSKEQQPEV